MIEVTLVILSRMFDIHAAALSALKFRRDRGASVPGSLMHMLEKTSRILFSRFNRRRVRRTVPKILPFKVFRQISVHSQGHCSRPYPPNSKTSQHNLSGTSRPPTPSCTGLSIPPRMQRLVHTLYPTRMRRKLRPSRPHRGTPATRTGLRHLGVLIRARYRGAAGPLGVVGLQPIRPHAEQRL